MQARSVVVKGVMFFAAIAATAAAQVDFDAGSDGTFGAIDVPADTEVALDMPPDGVFHATTINIAAGATLTFNKNPLNTPVFLLATQDISIDGSIVVSGEAPTSIPRAGGVGGPGGFDGGVPGDGSLVTPGAGLGPGAGGGGNTAFNQCPGGGENGAGRGAYRSRGGTTNSTAQSCYPNRI